MIPSGSSSNTPLGVTTTTTGNMTVSNSKVTPTTPFCESCGAWVEVKDELNVSPFQYCEWCSPKKPKKVRVSKKGRK